MKIQSGNSADISISGPLRKAVANNTGSLKTCIFTKLSKHTFLQYKII